MSREAVKSPSRRYFTQLQLDELSRNATELVQEAVDAGNEDNAHAVVLRIQTARNGLADLFPSWSAATLSYIRESHGEVAMARAMNADRWLAIGLSAPLNLEETRFAESIFADASVPADQIAELMRNGNGAEAKRYWDAVESATSKLHDFRIDWSTEILSHVYREYGSEGVAGALAHAAAQPWWSDRMPGDLALDPVTRITGWSFFLGVGNFGTVSVSEEDDRFIIHHQVCGSCGKQELRGRHEEPWSFARVEEPIPALNFGIAGYTVYRAHLAAWHYVMPTSKGFAPWPAIDCSGVPGRCWFTIYKDPGQTPEPYFEKIGVSRETTMKGNS